MKGDFHRDGATDATGNAPRIFNHGEHGGHGGNAGGTAADAAGAADTTKGAKRFDDFSPRERARALRRARHLHATFLAMPGARQREFMRLMNGAQMVNGKVVLL